MFISHGSPDWVSNPMYLLSKVCLVTLSAFHGSALIISSATRSNPVALPRFIEAPACGRCAVSNRGNLLPSSFVAREADSSLHNSIFDSSMLPDSSFSLAYRLSYSVQCSRLTTAVKHHREVVLSSSPCLRCVFIDVSNHLIVLRSKIHPNLCLGVFS